jgi:hypothetical protein
MTTATTVYCTVCGEKLLSTFRECNSCGASKDKFSDTPPSAEDLRKAASGLASGAATTSAGGQHDSTNIELPPIAAGNWGRPGGVVVGLGQESDSGVSLPRNETNIISRSEGERDRIYDALEASCRSENVKAMLFKSPPFNPTVWVSCECWLPHEKDSRLRERVWTILTIRGREFHKFPFEIDIEINRGETSEKYQSIIKFTTDTARTLVKYLSHRVGTIKFDRTGEFGSEKNKTELKSDPVAVTGIALLPVSAILLFTGTLAIPGLVIGAAGIGCLIAAHYRRGRLYVLSNGKPAQEPRKLVRMDSWQALVTGLGPDAQKVKNEVSTALSSSQDGARLSNEKIWYRDIDGKVERDQIVVTFRRAIAFIHIYPDGNDLYLGWDAHINGGTWVEQKVGTGRDPKTGAFCELRTIVAGWQTPVEYDLFDGNSLIERVHAAVTKVVKRAMADRKIDQEIDFKILREKREGIAGHAEVGGATSAQSRPVFRREK